MRANVVQFEAPDLAPIIVTERTAEGWRGLTGDGEIYDVKVKNGGEIPERLCISGRDGKPLGYRALPKEVSAGGEIHEYLKNFTRACELVHANELAPALPLMERALDVAPTTRAHFGRAMILLGLGRWREGFDLYERCERIHPLMRPVYRDALSTGLVPWRGEDLEGKHILLTHDHGFGDSIMCLRFVPMLKAMGATVTIMAPPELAALAAQKAPVVDELIEADYFCPLLLLLHWLQIEPDRIPLEPYLEVNRGLVERWRKSPALKTDRPKVGIAWSVGVMHPGDYPRSIPLSMLVEKFLDAELYSLQIQEGSEAAEFGVNTFAFKDFADCAALMWLLDEVVTIDTAALHLAGAIGHPRITALLSHWASWRWLSPWYRNVKFCRQQSPGDWASAFRPC